MTRNRRLLQLGMFAAAFVGVLLTCASSLHAATMRLDQLISSNGKIIVGDKRFDNFGYLATGDMPDAADVNVSSRTDSKGNYGIRFQGGFADLQGGGSSDALITYRVTVLDRGRLISKAHIAGNPDLVGNSGFVSVTETFLEGAPNNSMSIYDIDPGNTKLVDWTAFRKPTRVLHVQKDILAFANSRSAATLSFVDQTFSQVPEPGSMLLAGIGLIGLASTSRRKRFRRTRKG